jgi:hypothetical protein
MEQTALPPKHKLTQILQELEQERERRRAAKLAGNAPPKLMRVVGTEAEIEEQIARWKEKNPDEDDVQFLARLIVDPKEDVQWIVTGIDRDDDGIKRAENFDFGSAKDGAYRASAVAHQSRATHETERPKRVLVEHYDGGVVEGWYILTDGMVTLCDLRGTPHPERRRFAIGENEEKIAQALLRQRFNLPETGFGRPLRYPKMQGIV